MPIVFDARSSLRNKPGVHALIAGVSRYVHLPGGMGETLPHLAKLGQLSSCAISAYAVFDWLFQHRTSLSLPLATCRWLASPSGRERYKQPQLNDWDDPCTGERFVEVAREWYADALSHPDNVSIFYFAGHGWEASNGGGVMLMADTRGEGLTVEQLYRLKARSDVSKDHADDVLGLYFFDCCRDINAHLSLWKELLTEDELRSDYRHSFFSTSPGTQAYARTGEQTNFSKALLRCLNGAAAKPEIDLERRRIRWCVTSGSVLVTLVELSWGDPRRGPAFDPRRRQNPQLEQKGGAPQERDFVFYCLDSQPDDVVVPWPMPAESLTHLLRDSGRR